nr:nitroreductase family protein [uncultured Cetobacterium sp.]
MDIITGIKERRSIRKFKDKKVDRELLKEIVEIARFSPSWANYQIARYTFIDDQNTINKLAHDGVKNFVYNINTLKEARGVLVLSYVKGKSGKLEEYGVQSDSNSNIWEIFDAGIACQTFCLAAHAKGIGTVIMGVINDKAISEIIDLPKEEGIAALIVYGYPEGEIPETPKRKVVEELTRFI